MEVLDEYCPLPPSEIVEALRGMAHSFNVREGALDGVPLFFKECSDLKLLSSLAFDVANFATMVTSALVSTDGGDLGAAREQRFESQADDYIRSIKPTTLTMTKIDIQEVPGFRFSAVLSSASKIWLISYVSGSTFTYFRKNLNDTAKSFKHAWESRLQAQIQHTIPLLNNSAPGYLPDKLGWQIDDLRKDARGDLVRWSEKDQLPNLLRERV